MLKKDKIDNVEWLDFSDVLIKPSLSAVNSRKDVELTRKFSSKDISHGTDYKIFEGWQPIPIMSANMDTVTGIKAAKVLLSRNWIAVLHKYVSISEITELFDWMEENNIDFRNCFISRGSTEEDKEKLKDRLKAEPRIKSVCIDVANGMRVEVLEYCYDLKNTICADKILMVGNVGSEEILEHYMHAGADIIKMGIGPGSVCLTRVQTGVGAPQISLTVEMVKKIKELRNAGKKVPLICLDGGCKNIGDIAKGFVAGADFVMVGGMLAGHYENPGEIETIDGVHKKRLSGMAASVSQWNGVPDYGIHEGKTVYIDVKGHLEDTLKDIEGGLRSTGTYINADFIKQFRKASFIRTNVQENKVYK